MDSIAIEKVSFQGKTRYLSCNSEGKSKRVSDCPFGTANFGETRGLSEFVKKHSFPNASVEETIGKTHDNRTYRVYIADPTEKVNDIIKKNHDYVVYDVEPYFPEIKFFINTEEEAIKKGFRNIAEYYKRLENYGLNQGNSNIVNISKLKQRITEICSKIVDESADLRAEKLKTENKIRYKQQRIKAVEERIPEYKKELSQKQQRLEKVEQSLQKKEQTLSNWKYKQELLQDKQKKKQNEINRVNYYLEKNTFAINEIKSRIENYRRRIEFIKNYINNAPSLIDSYQKEIKDFEQRIANINKLLQPHLKKIQDFYTVNGIKIIKHM